MGPRLRKPPTFAPASSLSQSPPPQAPFSTQASSSTASTRAAELPPWSKAPSALVFSTQAPSILPNQAPSPTSAPIPPSAPTQALPLSTIYEWQATALPLALDFQPHIVEGHPTNTIRGEIPAKWQARFCNPMTTLGSRLEQKRKRGSSPSSAIPHAKKDANDGSVFCNSFNKAVCSRPNCHRKHLCEICCLKDHGSRTCKKNASGGASSSK